MPCKSHRINFLLSGNNSGSSYYAPTPSLEPVPAADPDELVLAPDLFYRPIEALFWHLDIFIDHREEADSDGAANDDLGGTMDSIITTDPETGGRCSTPTVSSLDADHPTGAAGVFRDHDLLKVNVREMFYFFEDDDPKNPASSWTIQLWDSREGADD